MVRNDGGERWFVCHVEPTLATSTDYTKAKMLKTRASALRIARGLREYGYCYFEAVVFCVVKLRFQDSKLQGIFTCEAWRTREPIADDLVGEFVRMDVSSDKLNQKNLRREL